MLTYCIHVLLRFCMLLAIIGFSSCFVIAQEVRTICQTYMATIGSAPIMLTLTIAPLPDSQNPHALMVYGSYQYTRSSTDITLIGDTAYYTTPTTILVRLHETFLDRSKGDGYTEDTTGFWDITLRLDTLRKPLTSVLSGQWQNKQRRASLPIQMQSCIGYHRMSRSNDDISFTYPELRTPYQSLSTTFSNEAQQYITESMKEAYAMEADMREMKRADSTFMGNEVRFSATNEYTVMMLTDSLLTLRETGYQFSGGAHGMTSMNGRNYYRIARPPYVQELKLGNIFRAPATDYVSTLNNLIMRDLRRQQAAWVESGELTSVADELQKDNLPFMVLPAGLAFIFNQYYAGPYSQGIFTVLVRYEQIRQWISPTSPVYSLAMTRMRTMHKR